MLLTWKIILSQYMYKQCFTVALQGTGLQAPISESFPKLLQLFPYHLTVCLLQSKNKTIRKIIITFVYISSSTEAFSESTCQDNTWFETKLNNFNSNNGLQISDIHVSLSFYLNIQIASMYRMHFEDKPNMQTQVLRFANVCLII